MAINQTEIKEKTYYTDDDDKAIEILQNGAKFGEFDKDVVDLFVEHRVWERKERKK